MMIDQCQSPRRVVLATPPVYQAPLPLEVHLPMIPQGPAMIASVLRDRGHHVACFDAYERSCRRAYFDASEFAEFLRAERPDWLGLSVYSDGFPSALRMIEIAKAVLPDCSVVVGGPHFTLFPDAVTPEVDFVVVGEGELAMPALVEGSLPQASDAAGGAADFLFLVGRRSEKARPGTFAFRLVHEAGETDEDFGAQAIAASLRMAANAHTQVVTMRGRLANDSLGRLPYPAYDLFLNQDAVYQFDEPALGLDGPMLNLNTSRGCSYGCSFCSVEGVWGKSYCWFPTEWILGLVADLKKRYGLRSVFFREDEFIMRPRAPSAWQPSAEDHDDVLRLARGLHALGIRWAVENRADAFGSKAESERYFKNLASLGLSGVFVGVESASNIVRNRILNKHLSEDALHAFFAWTHEAGVRTVANVMYGVRRKVDREVLSDSREDWAKTDALLATLKPSRVDRYVYVGVPVSPLYRDYLQRGDYDMIDVNGYLYPKGFSEVAHEIYGTAVEMAHVPGHPNLRVGPGILPGIPSTTEDSNATAEGVVSALARLAILPGVVEATLTPLGALDQFQRTPRAAHARMEELGFRRLRPAMVEELLRRYRPCDRAIVQRLACGPTFLIATLRTPSGEVAFLALHLAHDVAATDALVAAVSRAVSLANIYFRSEFIHRFMGNCPVGPAAFLQERRPLRMVQR